MKKLIVGLILISLPVSAQIDISAGMGISFFNNSSMQDYINTNFPGSDELSTFNSEVELFIEGDYELSPTFQLGFEYVYSIYSYTTSFVGSGQYELAYNEHKPSILAYYVIPGTGYKFKFGGGLGIRYIDLDEDIFTTTNYTSLGFGALLRAQGLTLLSDNLYANIGVTVRYDLTGEPENDGEKIRNNVLDENLSMNSVSISIDLGVSYVF